MGGTSSKKSNGKRPRTFILVDSPLANGPKRFEDFFFFDTFSRERIPWVLEKEGLIRP